MFQPGRRIMHPHPLEIGVIGFSHFSLEQALEIEFAELDLGRRRLEVDGLGNILFDIFQCREYPNIHWPWS
ncbi:hypothetical protein D9M68_945730 [compost metagenome]